MTWTAVLVFVCRAGAVAFAMVLLIAVATALSFIVAPPTNSRVEGKPEPEKKESQP